ncbi:MAG: OmpA family protein [Bacteroidota bacterium]
MRYSKIFVLIAIAFPLLLSSQDLKSTKGADGIVAEGFIYDQVSGAPLNQVAVTLYDDMLKTPIGHAETNLEGLYTIHAPKVSRYKVLADKPTYFNQELVIDPVDGKIKADLGLERKPGYVFDITIFDKAFDHNPINTLRDCKVEIYNNTTKQQELAIERLPKSTFNFSFAEGNHYTVLVRKPGYLNRRIEVYVNVNGCILCVDGMGVKEPDLVPLMTHCNEVGYFLGAIDLDSIQIGKRFQLNNIYYDFDKWNLRPEAMVTLDKLSVFLKDNAGIKVELGSHTDARGADAYNLLLSEKRAKSCVDYMVSSQGINPDNITWKGYGETQLVNKCEDGVSCSEAEHQQNRRTEIKIIGIVNDPLWHKTLKQIIEDKDLYRKAVEQEKQKTFTQRS